SWPFYCFSLRFLSPAVRVEVQRRWKVLISFIAPRNKLPPRLLTEVAARLLKAATAIGPRSRPEVSVSGVRASRTPPGPLTGRIQRHAEIVDHHVRISTGAA